MNERTYSVLMSVYAKEKPENLAMSLNSLLSQTLMPDEIVLVEDGPLTPELYSVIGECENAHPGLFHVVPLENNVGLGCALNEGLKACKNELVARMDSDDVCFPDRMEAQTDYMLAHPETDILSGAIEEFDGGIENVTGRRVVPLTNEAIWRFAKTRSPFNHAAVMYKKSAVLAVQGYRGDLKRVEDHDLWMRMHQNGAVGANLERSLLYGRAGDDMHRRKHGKENARALYEFYLGLYRSGQIGFFRFVYDIVCACSLQLMPAWLHKFCYKLIRLKKKPYGSKAKRAAPAGSAEKLPNGSEILHKFSDEELKTVQTLILEIYRDVKKLCDEHGLTLMLGGGSCLGAVRHRGFIPWDDDMDCVMPRADYEKFKLIFDSALGEKYALQVPNLNGHIASNLFMKVVRREGPFYREIGQALSPGEKGLWLDIVPMDYAPENPFKRLCKGLFCDALAFLAVSQYLYKFKDPLYAAAMKGSFWGRMKYYARNALGFLMSVRPYTHRYNAFDRLCRGKEETSLVTFPAGIRHYLGECMPKDVFLPAGEGEFEGESAVLPGKAHRYLRHMYGADYMKLPPEEKRKGHPFVRAE